MSETQTQEIVVDDETALEVLRYGSGKPAALLLAGVHGNEKTGPLVLEELSTQLQTTEVQGMVSILPVANPRAFVAYQRNHPEDGQDLNRCLPGGIALLDSPTGRLVSTIQQLIKSHDLVIDIHGFPGQLAPIFGVALGDGSAVIRRKSEELLMTFDPEVIWELDTRKTEPGKSGSACSYALEQDIAAFGIELPDPEHYSIDRQSRTQAGLLRVLIKLGAITKAASESAWRSRALIPRYERRLLRAQERGTFVPRREIFEPVAPGDVLGQLAREDGSMFSVNAEVAGVVLTIAPASQMEAGKKMLTIGIPIGH